MKEEGTDFEMMAGFVVFTTIVIILLEIFVI